MLNRLLLSASIGVLAGQLAAPLPVLAQVANPDLVIEGPIDEITANTITVMGIKVNVPSGTADTPTKLGVPLASLNSPLPGRPDGFIGGTAIVTGGSTNGVVTASSVFSDVNENVVVGEVTSTNPLTVNGLEMVALPASEARIPSSKPTNIYGFEINPNTVDLNSLISIEGYLGTDKKLYYHTLEADTGAPVNAAAEVSILRAQCRDRAGTGRDELEVRGAVHPAAGQALRAPVATVTLEYQSRNPRTGALLTRTASVRPVIVPPTPPATTAFYAEYRFNASNLTLADCPLKVVAKWRGDSDPVVATVDMDATP